MKKTIKRKILTLTLALVMMLSLLPTMSLTSHAATSSQINSSAYCTVKISSSLLNKKGTQYAKVKLNTYDGTGWFKTGAKVRITLTDGNGKYICSWIAKGGDTLKLGDDHSVYRIYVSYYTDSSNSILSKAFNFINIGQYKWKISSAQNCAIY